MNEQKFVESREKDWLRLNQLCDIASPGVRNLSSEQVREFVQLYRRASTDLAAARTESANDNLVGFLNELVGRAYSTLYLAPRAPMGHAILGAILMVAQTVRRRKVFVLTSAFLFFGSAVFAFGVLDLFPQTRANLLPESQKALFDSWKKGEFPERSPSISASMTGFYAQNNPRIAVIAGAVGAGTFGLMSVYMLFQNGAILGTLGHEVASVDKLGFLLVSIAPHGVTELSGIILAGSAGLVLGWALVSPGRRSRGRALQEAGPDAIVLLAGSVILMFMAAPIEGFFSFSPNVPSLAKIAVATGSAVAWASFWTFAGREEA
jgi:uncharacterized membrane protein SpoIIM required for sporulation